MAPERAVQLARPYIIYRRETVKCCYTAAPCPTCWPTGKFAVAVALISLLGWGGVQGFQGMGRSNRVPRPATVIETDLPPITRRFPRPRRTGGSDVAGRLRTGGSEAGTSSRPPGPASPSSISTTTACRMCSWRARARWMRRAATPPRRAASIATWASFDSRTSRQRPDSIAAGGHKACAPATTTTIHIVTCS